MGDAFDNITLSEVSNSSYKPPAKANIKVKKQRRSHEYYVNDFLNSFKAEDSSIVSDNFDHIRECQICRTMIKVKLDKQDKQSKQDKQVEPVVEQFDIPKYKENIVNTFTNPDNKSILVIILIGLLLIIVIDLFVRIGRRSKCYS